MDARVEMLVLGSKLQKNVLELRVKRRVRRLVTVGSTFYLPVPLIMISI